MTRTEIETFSQCTVVLVANAGNCSIGYSLWRAVCTKNNVDVVKLILGRVARGRGLVGVTYVGVAYTKWIVVVV